MLFDMRLSPHRGCGFPMFHSVPILTCRLVCSAGVAVLLSLASVAQAQTVSDSVKNLDTMTVNAQGVQQNLDRLGTLSQAIQPTSVLTEDAIVRKNADDLAQAVTNESGVCVLTAYGSCGFKQIQINGLGANHTTLLVDGLPLNSALPSFYGADALTTAGVADIEIARGPGASLLAPGAIGGTMDIRFHDPTKTAFTADAAMGNNGWNRLAFSGTTLSPDGKLGLLVAGHHFQQGQWDANNKGVNPRPSQTKAVRSGSMAHSVATSLGTYGSMRSNSGWWKRWRSTRRNSTSGANGRTIWRRSWTGSRSRN